MKILTKTQILILQKILVGKFGGIDGIRDENLLDAAISAPFQTFGGQDLFPTLTEKAARLGFGLIKNHPFLDGNKRIGTHAMLVFLKINGVEILAADDDLTDTIYAAAGSMTYENFLNWLEAHTQNET